MLAFSMCLYIVTAILSFLVAYDFYRTKNGALRRALIFLFSGMGVALATRGTWGLMALDQRVNLNPHFSIFSIAVMFFVLARFYYVIKKMNKK